MGFTEVPKTFEQKIAKEGLNVMLSDISNDEQHHWNPVSSNTVIPLRQDVHIEVYNPNDGID